MKSGRARFFGTAFFLVVIATLPAVGQDQPGARTSMATSDRWNNPGWWPTKGTPALQEYVGPGACTRCHSEIAASQRTTPMFQAAQLARDSRVPQQGHDLKFSDDAYNYVLSRAPDAVTFSVSSKTGSVSANVNWAFGVSESSQTYILKQGETFLESRLSYYRTLSGLDITFGHNAAAPATISQAPGKPVEIETVRRCFGCHSTASTVSGKFDPEHAMLGVTCEACHGPGLQHVTAMQSNPDQHASGTTLNPRKLTPVDSVDFCGACHRTPVDVAIEMPRHMGISSVRLQPYRLERSLCWGGRGDPRITCIACHDPHKPLMRDSASYDSACLKCHAQSGHTETANMAPACPTGTRDCASCHMPKYEIPWVHATYTDHFIRIVRPGSSFRE
jgi:hypothetical protein